MLEEYKNNGQLKIYLASPFFTSEQIERITFVEKIVCEKFDVFSPRMSSQITKNSTQADLLRTFNGDISHIDDADFLVAILDGHDTGTIFECGYSYSKNTPILYFNETREKGPNLMLAMSGKLPFITKTSTINSIFKDTSFTDVQAGPRDILITSLDYIYNNGLEKVINNTKNIFNEVE